MKLFNFCRTSIMNTSYHFDKKHTVVIKALFLGNIISCSSRICFRECQQNCIRGKWTESTSKIDTMNKLVLSLSEDLLYGIFVVKAIVFYHFEANRDTWFTSLSYILISLKDWKSVDHCSWLLPFIDTSAHVPTRWWPVTVSDHSKGEFNILHLGRHCHRLINWTLDQNSPCLILTAHVPLSGLHKSSCQH